jgi:hypothetical protein
MKADLSLTERQRNEADDRRELRAALVRRHFDVMDEQQLVADGALLQDLRMGAFVRAVLQGPPARTPSPRAAPMPTEHVMAAGRVGRPDLRAQLGLS